MEIKVKFIGDSELSQAINNRRELGLPKLKYFYDSLSKDHLHIGAFNNSLLIGLIALSENEQWAKDCYHIEYVVVDDAYKRLGIGQLLIERAAELAASKKYSLKFGMLSPEGEAFLAKARAVCSQAGVRLIDQIKD